MIDSKTVIDGDYSEKSPINTYLCLYACMFACMYVCIYACTRIYTYSCVYKNINTYTCIYGTYIYLYMQMCHVLSHA